MRLAFSSLLFALYIAIDFANPLLPGALVFDPDASVEARQSGRFSETDDEIAAGPMPAPTAIRSANVPPAKRRAITAGGPPRRDIVCVRIPPPRLQLPGEDEPPSGPIALT